MTARTFGAMLVMITLDPTSRPPHHASNASAAGSAHADAATTRCAAQTSKSIDALDAVSSTGTLVAKPAPWLPNEVLVDPSRYAFQYRIKCLPILNFN